MLLLSISGALPAFGQADPFEVLESFSASFEALAGEVSPAVVQILSTGIPPGSTRLGIEAVPVNGIVTGSGVIVHPEAYILTNAHLVAGAQRVRALLTLPSEGTRVAGNSIVRPRGRLMDAEVLGYDLETNLAISTTIWTPPTRFSSVRWWGPRPARSG